MSRRLLLGLGTVVLLLVIFGVPAVLVPMSMNDVPDRSKIKVFATYQDAIFIVQQTFDKHADPDRTGRLMPIPENTRTWVELINPMGRQAPGGGPAVLPRANTSTGAVGVVGDGSKVVITMPDYRGLKSESITIVAVQ